MAKKYYATERGYEGDMAEAFIDAFIKNFKKGEKIGIEKNKIETAKNALALGLSIEQASKISSLSVEEILKLA